MTITHRQSGWDDRWRRATPISIVGVLALIASVFAAGPAPAGAEGGNSTAWLGAGWEDSSVLSDVDFTEYPGSLYSITRSINADAAWHYGATGFGVDVAVIDTGVAPVPLLSPDWKLINGPDLSFDSQSPDHRYIDSYGHGTHIAGVIAGRDPAAPNNLSQASKDYFLGVAPDSRIVNMKVGTYDGAVDVSQVIARHRLGDPASLRPGHEHSGHQPGVWHCTVAAEQDIVSNLWIGFNEIQTNCWKEGRGRYADTVCEDFLVATDTLWNGGDWNGTSWSGTSWSGLSWSGLSWSGLSWSDKTWNGLSWSGLSWSGRSWSGTSRSGRN